MKEFSHKVLQESKTDPEPSGEDHKHKLPLPPLVRLAIYDSFTSAPRRVD
ncbi:hypothetical protein HKBW3S43_01523, partial [Candidatus Hakubella thermalkaliphila]